LALWPLFVPLLDPSYVKDFWTSRAISRQPIGKATRIQGSADGSSWIEAPADRSSWRKALELSKRALRRPDVRLDRCQRRGQGPKRAPRTVKGICLVRLGAKPRVVRGSVWENTVTIDNSKYLALQTYYRHNLRSADRPFDFPPLYDSFRNADGALNMFSVRIMVVWSPTPSMLRPPRGKSRQDESRCNLSWMATRSVEAGVVPNESARGHGRFFQRTIPYLVQRQRAAHRASDRVGETHVVSYQGVLEQALRDLSAWVERAWRLPPAPASR